MNWRRLALRMEETRRRLAERSDAFRLYGDGIRQALCELLHADPSEDKQAAVIRALCRVWKVEAAESQRRHELWGEAMAAHLRSNLEATLARIHEVDAEVL